jgi:L-ascorbate metabolism protein UlaG (beta-lactamase superfamily)
MSKVKINFEMIASLEEFVENKSIPSDEIHIAWIGQAGFIFKFKDKLMIIDPYLSDHLSKKYKGKLFPHIRLMEIPISPEKIVNVDYIISSHAHSDHMDPETLTILSDNNQDCKIIVPAAEVEEAINRGVKRHQITPANDQKSIFLEDEIKITGIASSHEDLKINEKGEFHFLGFVFDLGGFKVYHSGDCIPYEGLYEKLKDFNIDLALLPINGRDEYRLSNNIAGNFKISEVIEMCKVTGIENLIVHHFGMFSYNTVSNDELEQLKKRGSRSLKIIVPEINVVYKIRR